jgi:hypothetical protein
MNIKKQIRLTKTILISLFLVWMVAAVQIVQASSILPTGYLPSDQVVDNDVFASGQQVTIDGIVNGDVFVTGNQVQINGEINGSLFVMGQQVEVKGKVSGTTYIAAVSLVLKPEAILERNLYFIGVSLTTAPGSTIQRDLRTLCLGADLKGTISRDTKATIGILKVISLIFNTLGIPLQLPRSSLLMGGEAYLSLGGSLILSPLGHSLGNPEAAGGIDAALTAAWLLDRLRELGLLLFLSAIYYWLLRVPLKLAAQALRAKPLPGLGYGLLALLIMTNVFLVGVLVASLIFVVGLWLGFMGLWSFAAVFWVLAYAALLFVLAALWLFVAYGTKLIVAYLVGTWLFEKVLPKAAIPPFVAMAIGVLIYVLLVSIPMIGWVISVLVISWGLGAAWLAYRTHRISLRTGS